ncbi:MAG: hypothetical protein RIB45_02290 [Marivibrio sp.]|uniref:hypothetical protein n=1 Tax=Marivibrio sp. TaxID=2039719 RepID=UPI0032EEC623
MTKITDPDPDDDRRPRHPDSDELSMLIALLGRLNRVGVISDTTLQAVVAELHAVLVKGEPAGGGLTKEFRIVFQDGAVLDSHASKRR